jgi:hypothetical protein
VTGMMIEEPNIEGKALEAITAPKPGSGERSRHDRHQHTVEIYQHIPNGQLPIFPNATHMTPFDDDPATFNGTVEVPPNAVREAGQDRRRLQVV